MGELQKLYVTLALDAAQYAKGLEQAETHTRGFGERIKGALTGPMSTLGFIGAEAFMRIGGAAVNGLGQVVGGMIDMNSSLETSTLQFTTLMGDADLAAAHVKSLFEFAANTPFETQPIIDASLKLQTFGGAALNTMENLTLVGDAAAAVGAPIDEVAFWVGRLYSNLQAGQPFGEAAMRLQELGIMAPQARTELEAMQVAGASGSAIFAAFQGQLGAFTGAMEAQAGTWQGLTSTIKDQLGIMTATALKPFFDLVKEGMAGLAEWLASPEVQAGIQQLAAGFTALITKVSEFVTGSVIPFVQTHGPELKQILIALAAAFAGLLIIGAVVTAVNLLLNPIAWVVAAIGLLAAAWTGNWGGIRDKTEVVVKFLQGLIQGFLALVRGWWDEHGAAIVEAAQKAWALIQGLIDGVTKQIQLIVEAFRLAFAGDWEAFGHKIWEIWVTAWHTVIDFLSGLWDLVKPWLASLWNNFVTWFTETDWKSLGGRIIDGIIDGIRRAANALFEVVRALAGDALQAIKEALGISSSARALVPVGVAMVEGIIKGVNDARPALMYGLEQLMYDVEGLLGGAGSAGGIAGGFGRRFQQVVLDPMAERLAGMDETIGSIVPLFDRVMKPFGAAGLFGDWTDPAGAAMVLKQLTNLRNVLSGQGDWLQVAQVDMALEALSERNNLNQEYLRQQERLLSLENARADLDFLKSQMELLKLVKDNGLSPDILGGLQFGLAADPGALMDTMVSVMEALVRTASQELNLNSQPTLAGGAGGTATGGTWNISEQVINGGQHNYFYGEELSQLEQLQVLGL